MTVLTLVRRLLYVSALLMIGGIAISVMTHDAWLVVGHAAAIASAVVAAIAVLAVVVAGLRRIAADRPGKVAPDPSIDAHEQGLTGLEAEPAPGPSSASDEP